MLISLSCVLVSIAFMMIIGSKMKRVIILRVSAELIHKIAEFRYDF
jgi:hypothetical protein